MAFLEWEARLDVGVDAMNDQHRVLIDLMNQLHSANQAGRPKADQLAIANKLVDLAIKHFRQEERFMESIHYEGIDSHKRIHAKLESTLAEHMKAVESPSASFSDEFFYFLRSWLRAHIAGIDVKYGEVAKKAKKAS